MFEKVGVPILGVVENMSIHICSKCGHEEHIFGQGGGEKMCADFGVPFLGALPLDIQIRTEADSGAPTVVADPDGRIASIYKQIARKVAVRIAERQGHEPQVPQHRGQEHLIARRVPAAPVGRIRSARWRRAATWAECRSLPFATW
jgi:hypothetical protein